MDDGAIIPEHLDKNRINLINFYTEDGDRAKQMDEAQVSKKVVRGPHV